MRCSLALIASVAAFATVSGQYSGGFLQRRNGGNTVSSSFSKTITWFQGRDGQMHQKTQETQDKVIQDGSSTQQMHSKMLCQDGHCQHVVEVLAQPTMQEPQTMPMYSRPVARSVPPRLQNILERLVGPMQQHPQTKIGMERYHQPEMIIQGPHQTEVIIQPMTRPEWMYPDKQPTYRIDLTALRGAAQQQSGSSSSAFAALRILKLFILIITGYAAVLAVLKCRRLSDAREVSIDRPLAEPLVTGSEINAMQIAPAQDRKVSAVPLYLSGLYARANAKSESALVKKYMMRLYRRILG